MKLRQLGRTGLTVSEIGYGAWGIGKSEWVGATDELSLESLQAARDSGINFFDTALAYGDGHSERLLAQAFGNAREVIMASKVPPKNGIWPARRGSTLEEVFPRKYVLGCLERTLKNLGRETVDLYQFHVWNDDWANQEQWQSMVEEIRRSGKARFIGISINDHQPANSLQALASGLVDAVQVIYNIFDQSPDDKLLPYCQKNQIGVLARVPFDEGSLTGKIGPDSEFPAGDFRNQYFAGGRKQQVWEHLQRLVEDTGITIDQLPGEALRFCLSHPAVSSVIPGMRTPAHVAANVKASNRGPLSAALLEKIHRHRWVRNYYE
ncbi:MAG: aldo/keto reductase [Acidobacteria bacterium]|nr:aldo/keto reductase [Acidobacteriota bacterium]